MLLFFTFCLYDRPNSNPSTKYGLIFVPLSFVFIQFLFLYKPRFHSLDFRVDCGVWSPHTFFPSDSLVKNVVGASSSKEHPWIVFTAGAMGAGKSYTINW